MFILAKEIAHIFNNYLTAILGNINLAKLEENPLKIENHLSEAEEAVSKAKNLTDKLLNMDKGDIPIHSVDEIEKFIKKSIHDIFAESDKIKSENLPKENLQKSKKKKKILVMDDQPCILTTLGKILTRLGHKSEVALNGEEAIEKYKKSMENGEKFDIIIMDLMIERGMGGVETIKQLHNIDPDVKAIISSGCANDHVLTNFKEYGFIAMIAKPYLVEDLKNTLEQCNQP
ncbi:MAG: response regulator [Promethearchaeota archaeon]